MYTSQHTRVDVYIGLYIRFVKLFDRLRNTVPFERQADDYRKDLGFDDDVFFMAAVLDPRFGFCWLDDLPDITAREDLRQQITGVVYFP